MIVVGCKVLHFINDEDQEALGSKALRHKNAETLHRVYEFWVSVSVYDSF